MMKLLVLVLVLAVVGWLFFGRSRKSGRGESGAAGEPDKQPGKNGKGESAKRPQTMMVCAHCGVHLPVTEALTDAKGSAYCSDAHRLAGPHRP